MQIMRRRVTVVEVGAATSVVGYVSFWQLADSGLSYGAIVGLLFVLICGPAMVGWAGGVRASGLVSVVAGTLVSIIAVATGSDGRRLPHCAGIMSSTSGEPCGYSLADQALSGLVPAALVLLIGGCAALARRACRGRGKRASSPARTGLPS